MRKSNCSTSWKLPSAKTPHTDGSKFELEPKPLRFETFRDQDHYSHGNYTVRERQPRPGVGVRQ